MSYRCDTCNYETNRSTNYNRHLLSRKHKDNVNSLSLPNEHTQTQKEYSKSIPNEPDMYNTVYTAVKDIEPEIAKSDKVDNAIQIIADGAKSFKKGSDAVNKQINSGMLRKEVKHISQDVNDAVDTKKKSDSMLIVAVAIIASIVIIWVLFKDKITEIISGNNFNPANMDNTKIEWV